jgi:hypothetical protein
VALTSHTISLSTDEVPVYMKFHFAQAVRGMGEQQSLERAQRKGDGFPKLLCAVTALDSKSEKRKAKPQKYPSPTNKIVVWARSTPQLPGHFAGSIYVLANMKSAKSVLLGFISSARSQKQKSRALRRLHEDFGYNSRPVPPASCGLAVHVLSFIFFSSQGMESPLPVHMLHEPPCLGHLIESSLSHCE